MVATLHPPCSPDLALQFLLASKNEGIVPDIHKQLLNAQQAVPKKSVQKMLPVVTEMLDILHNSEGMANSNKPYISFSTQSRNFWITLHITVPQPNDSTFQY